jgi:putative SOS response-associated peptidase YedK
MIVTEPNDMAAEVHDRMPVFLTLDQFRTDYLSLQRLP